MISGENRPTTLENANDEAPLEVYHLLKIFTRCIIRSVQELLCFNKIAIAVVKILKFEGFRIVKAGLELYQSNHDKAHVSYILLFIFLLYT